MANKEFIYLSGKAKWAAKLFTPDQQYKCWSFLLYPDDPSYQKILEMKKGKEGTQGILNVIKKDDDGYCMTLKRPTEKLFKGRMQGFTPPLVVNADNSPFNAQMSIGNGSDVTCKVEYYTYNRPTGGKGSAIRLEAVRVDNLVPFEKEKDFKEAELKQVSGLTEQPPPLF